MTKKQKVFIIFKKFSSLLFLFFVCFCFFLTHKNFARGLEVSYPKVFGSELNENTSLPQFAYYLFNIGTGLGFSCALISLAIAGATYALSSTSLELKKSAKDRASGAISGLLVLLFTYLIITTINPQLSIFNLNKLPAASSQPQQSPLPPGVYFYQKEGCSGEASLYTKSVPDFRDLKNKIKSVKIQQNETYYISILYEKPDFWGKCQYIDPNGGCKKIKLFPSSASIHQSDPSPNGNGVYFFRKPCFNNKETDVKGIIGYCIENGGGYKKLDNSTINADSDYFYLKKLDSLTFEGVPEEEQDCIKYDKDGKCLPAKEGGRRPPTLAGENISSIIIDGNYLVLLVYLPEENTESSEDEDSESEDDSSEDVWTYCQEFPTPNDFNKLGPQQVKWEYIRNHGGVIPNYVLIIPIY